MKIALLADIHANFAALQAVSSAATGVHGVWFLGDAVGRGPDPLKVISWLQNDLQPNPISAWVLGNHDCMLANLLTDEEWKLVNGEPRLVIDLHRALVAADSEAHKFVAQEFNPGRIGPQERYHDGVHYLLVHGGQVDHPGYYRYVYPWITETFLPGEFDRLDKLAQKQGAPYVQIYGHTHVPALISAARRPTGWKIEPVKVKPGETYALDPVRPWIINPGSVGQPRDLDRRAAFAILNTEAHTVTFQRLEYSWRETAKKMIAEEYPPRLVEILRDATPDKETHQDWLEHYNQEKGQVMP